MKTLDRSRIDELVRELETGAYGLALGLGREPASAERVLQEAFADLAPSLPRTAAIVELREKLYARVRQRARRQEWVGATADAASIKAAAVSEDLHIRLVDVLEERQADEPVGRRRAVLIGFIGVAIIGALIAFVRVHADALAAAQPMITELSPAAAATDVSVSGDVRVKFGRRPASTPRLRLEPAHAVLESVHWDENTLVAVYTGLHLTTRYQLVLQADYRSHLGDVGHFEKRWTLTTQGYPVLSALTPSQDQKLAARVGKISVDFSYTPPVEPRLTITPADGTVTPGHWSGMTWSAGYSGLKPLTRYQATLTVDYGAAAASTQRLWTFSTEPGAPPAGVPVIWYGTSNPGSSADPQRLVALDWHGDLVGTMYGAVGYIQQVPDGSALSMRDGGYIDRNGVAFGPAGSPYTGIIADDSQSVCKLGDASGFLGDSPSWLFTGPLRGPLHRVGPAGSAGPRFGPTIIACSVASDRAVIADSGMAGTTAIRVIALSSGRVLYQRSYAPSGLSVTSSRDGRFLAEETPSMDAQGGPRLVTLIRRTLDGKVVARIDNQRVLRFSWDGKRVVTAPVFTGVGPNTVALFDWQTGKTLWRQPGDPGTEGRPVVTIAQPDGPAMAIAIGSQPRTGDVDQLWIVSADGQATQVVSNVFYPAFNNGF